jgi:hypothetical protein
MKNLIFAVLLIVVFSTASFAKEVIAEGETYSTLGSYKIALAENPVTINGEELKAYIISYQNTPMEVTVAIKKDKKCKSYLVLSDKLSVKYVCNKNYFGVEMLNKKINMEDSDYETSDASLNRNEYFHQKVLAPGIRGEIENAQLIAAFFPRLLN